ncbi:MAG: AAA family ATPase [Phycisphaerae bacterium]
MENHEADYSAAIEHVQAVRQQIAAVIRGQTDVIDLMLTVLLARGHALLEGVPGTAKTLSVRVMAMLLSCRFKRVQFTPDLMPSDILGTTIFTPGTSEFHLHRGPIFTDLLLADEINRSPAKTQAALLEAMAERHATIDGVRHLLSPIFTVFATQNPVEFEGTYPLPEAQQDRFLMKIRVGYPPAEAEGEILRAVHEGRPPDQLDTAVKPLLDIDAVIGLQQAAERVRVEPGILEYILRIVRSTREQESIQLGGGPRASIAVLTSAKAWALVQGRDFVTPDDVLRVLNPVLEHRITLTADAEIAGTDKSAALAELVSKQEIPR